MRERLLAMPVIGTALRVQERYVDDAADNFAASIAFFGFLSLFPLILLGISVLGFFLRGDADFEARVVEAVSDAVPGLGSALGDDGLAGVVDDVKRNAGSLLSVGTAVLLFTGLKVIAGAQRALAVVFRMDLIKGVAARAQQLLALLVLGSLALVGSAIGGSVGLDFGDGLRGVLISVGLTLLTFLVDLALFLVAYRFLSPSPGRPAWRVLLPGAVLAAIAWVALKAGAAALLTGGGNTDTYGQQLAAAVSLLAVLYLAGRVFMYGAELSGLRAELTTAPADDEVVGPLVEPRPLEDVGPKPAELARLAGFAAFLGVAGRLLDRR